RVLRDLARLERGAERAAEALAALRQVHALLGPLQKEGSESVECRSALPAAASTRASCCVRKNRKRRSPVTSRPARTGNGWQGTSEDTPSGWRTLAKLSRRRPPPCRGWAGVRRRSRP